MKIPKEIQRERNFIDINTILRILVSQDVDGIFAKEKLERLIDFVEDLEEELENSK